MFQMKNQKFKSHYQNLQEWVVHSDTIVEFNRDGSASRYMDYLNIHTIEEGLTQLVKYYEHNQLPNNVQLSFNISLRETPFFLNSTHLHFDIDVTSDSKFYLTDKEYIASFVAPKTMHSEFVDLPFIPENVKCEYIVEAGYASEFSRTLNCKSVNE